jgi:hypothetical protein
MKDYTIGAELTVSIEPDHYYLKRGDMVTLSGILRGIFGPLSESQITVERTFNREEAQPLVTWTDSSGRYAVADNLLNPNIYVPSSI